MLKRAAVVLGGALALTSCGGTTEANGEQAFSVQQVRQAFGAHGIRLKPSTDEHVTVQGADVPVLVSTYAGPYFSVSVYPAAESTGLAVRVTSVWTEPGQPEPVIRWAHRRNVSVEYDASRSRIRRKIAAALGSLSRSS